MPSRERVQAFIAMVESNAHVEAIEAFYHPHASMQENNAAPRVGRDVLVAHERAFLERLQSVHTHRVETFLVDGDHVVVNWVFEFVDRAGKKRRMEELALQVWEGDRIAQERFFYDPAQMAAS
jgi:ketosteroid isomerase-like protein